MSALWIDISVASNESLQLPSESIDVNGVCITESEASSEGRKSETLTCVITNA